MINKKILVTGGAGYIGSKICYDLTDQGYEVFIIDNLSTGHKELINKKAKFYYGDICDYDLLNDILKKNNIKNIIHLAASLDVNESEKNPCKYYLNNVEGTNNILKVGSKNRIKNFIFSSTCAVYGDLNKNFKVNENSYCNPTSHYGKTKLICEFLIKKYANQYKFSYGILRYFNVAGADKYLRTGHRGNSDTLFANLAKISTTTAKQRTIKIYGNNYNTPDGTCVRDYICVSDLSNFHIEFLKRISKKKISKTLNCGYGLGYSVLEVVKIFEKIIKKKINVKYLNKRKGDVSAIINDNKKFAKYFNLSNKKRFSTIEEMVETTLEWRKKILKKIN